jgi:2Fe-2S ferredoxin
MTRVRVLPAEIEFEARVGQTLMEAAHANGLYWPTTCGGQGTCTTCLSEIVSGQECLAEMGRSERKRLVSERGEAFLMKPMRLACQAGVMKDGVVTLTKVGVRQSDA